MTGYSSFKSKVIAFWHRFRTARNLGQIRQTVRFDMFFAVTIFLPTLLLSYFAMSSITALSLSRSLFVLLRPRARSRSHCRLATPSSLKKPKKAPLAKRSSATPKRARAGPSARLSSSPTRRRRRAPPRRRRRGRSWRASS